MSKKNSLSKEEALEVLESMLLQRKVEERIGQLYNMGHVKGFCHLYIGQEAVATGVVKASNPKTDTYITAYRCHTLPMLLGIDEKKIVAEACGKRDGMAKGKGGSMHMFDSEKGFYGGHAIVGAQIPVGTGLAFAHKYKKDKGVNFCFIGDGASNQGQVFESFNMAALWKLPVVFIIENNNYAMGTSIARHTTTKDFSTRSIPWDFPGESVNGMDYMAVKEATERAAEHCRSGKGPYLLSMETYRYRGHSVSDPAKYRTKEEVEEMRTNHDPIGSLEKFILSKKFATEDEIKEINKATTKQAKEAADFAVNDAETVKPEDIYANVFVE